MKEPDDDSNWGCLLNLLRFVGCCLLFAFLGNLLTIAIVAITPFMPIIIGTVAVVFLIWFFSRKE